MASELPQEGAYFGASELERTDGVDAKFLAKVLTGRNLIDDINAAGAQGKDLFQGWQYKVQGALNDAYLVYLHVLSGGDAALKEVLNHTLFPALQRIQRTNLALIALQLSAQPCDTAQSKACSAYAAVLRYAALHNVEPANFVAFMSGVTLNACKTAIRKMKKAPSTPTAEQAETAPVPVTDNAPANVPEESPEAREALDETTSNLPPTSSKSAIPMKATLTSDSRIQSSSAAIITITIEEENGTSNSIRYRLNPAEAQIVLAIIKKEYGTLLRFAGALVTALKTPTRTAKNQVLRYISSGRTRTTKYQKKGGRSTPVK